MQRDIRRLKDFAAMKDEDRRQMLRSLSDAEYLDIVTVCANMPYVEMKIRSEGMWYYFSASFKICLLFFQDFVILQFHNEHHEPNGKYEIKKKLS